MSECVPSESFDSIFGLAVVSVWLEPRTKSAFYGISTAVPPGSPLLSASSSASSPLPFRARPADVRRQADSSADFSPQDRSKTKKQKEKEEERRDPGSRRGGGGGREREREQQEDRSGTA